MEIIINNTGKADPGFEKFIANEHIALVTTDGVVLRKPNLCAGILLLSGITLQPILMLSNMSDENNLNCFLRIDPSLKLYGPSEGDFNEAAPLPNGYMITHEINGPHAFYPTLNWGTAEIIEDDLEAPDEEAEEAEGNQN